MEWNALRLRQVGSMAGTIPSRKRVGGKRAPGLLSLSASGGKTLGEPAPGSSGRPPGRAPAGAAAKAPGEPRPSGGAAHKTGAAEGALAAAGRGRGSPGEPQGEPLVPRCTRHGGRARGRYSLPAPAAATAPCPEPPLRSRPLRRGRGATMGWAWRWSEALYAAGSRRLPELRAVAASERNDPVGGRGGRGEGEEKEEEGERRPGCSYCSAPAPAGTRGAAEPRSSPPVT